MKLPAPAQPQPRKRVAAYARVSTMKDAQENSLQSQQDYFAEYAVQNITRKAGDRLRDDQVDLTRFAILDHSIELIPVF